MAKNTLPAPVTMAGTDKTTPETITEHKAFKIPSIAHFRVPKRRGDAPSNEHGPPKIGQRSQDSPRPIAIDISDVVENLAIYQRFRLPSLAPGVEITDLPNFDDVTLYGIPKSVQEDLWKLEAQRLVKAVTQEEAICFTGSAVLSKDSANSYGILDGLAGRTAQALVIVTHDSNTMLRKDDESWVELEQYINGIESLKYIRDEEDDAQPAGPHARQVSNEDFFAFVDYCTAVLARYLCSAVMGTSIHINLLAHLARVCTKIKVVSADMRRSADISLEASQPDDSQSRRNNRSRQRRRGPMFPSRMSDDHTIALRLSRRTDKSPWEARKAQETDSGLFTTVDTERTKKERLHLLYVDRCETYQRSLVALLEGLLSHIQGIKVSQISSPFFEFTGMVYETGFERFRTLVFQDEEQNFVGTSDTHIVNYARNAFHLLDQAVSSLQLHTTKHTMDTALKPVPGSSLETTGASVGTLISWNYTPDHHDNIAPEPSRHIRTPCRLRSMSDIITVLVPLLLANPSVVVPMSDFFGRIAFDRHMRLTSQGSNERQTDNFKPRAFGRYTAFVSLTTEAYYSHQQKLRHSDEPRSLSNALMRNNYLYSGDGPFPYSRVKTTTPSTCSSTKPSVGNVDHFSKDQESSLERITLRREEVEHVGKRMKTWVFEEKGVMVKCKTYVALTMLSAILLASGGLAVGVTLGPRISAVDPFNLTSYCWALAAFVILISKSVRVKEWSWNDFLHCRVLCTSVSELSSVTGIDEQLILAKLVQDDTHSILETRGPFNQVFEGRKSGDGFSIDRPIGILAMLLSGIIMIEVESLDGRRLVSLDLRRGTKIAVVQNQGKNYYQCLYSKEGQILDPAVREVLGEEGQESKTQVQLKRGELTWTRALGLYSNKEAFFV